MSEKRKRIQKQTTLASGDPPILTDPPPPSIPTPPMTTRSTATAPTTQEITTQPSAVTDALSGKKYLEQIGVTVIGTTYDQLTLVDALLRITQIRALPLPTITAIRAAAFILRECATAQIADTVANHAIAALAPQMAKLQEETERLTRLTPRDAEEPGKDSQEINTKLDSIREMIENITKRPMEEVPPSSYKLALMAGLGQEERNKLIMVAARTAIKGRQVTIGFTNDSAIATGKFTQTQMAEKVKLALNAISNENAPELILKSVNRYRNGNAIIELSSADVAEYLQKPEVKRAFVQALDPNTSIKERTYSVMFLFMPITFDPSRLSCIPDLEEENGWQKGSVVAARWAKPPNKRTDNQQVAHLLVTLNDPQLANTIIQNGFMWDQQKLRAKKS